MASRKMKLRWVRTHLEWAGGGQVEEEGEARDGEVSIGRAYRIPQGPLKGMCAWCMYATRPYVDLRFTRWGEAASKQEGQQHVAEAYAELLRRAAG